MHKQYCIITIILTVLVLTLTGCRDSSEVDDNVYAVTIGLDKGVNNKVIVTIQYPTYGSMKNADAGGGSGKSEGGSNMHSAEAPSLLEAIDMMNMAISRRVVLTHTKMLVISEDLAKKGIGDFLSPLSRFRGARSTMFVIVTKGTARDFIDDNKTNIGGSVTKSIELMMAQSKNTGFFPYQNFNSFYRNTVSTYGNSMAIYAGLNDLQQIDIGAGKGKTSIVTQRELKPGELPRLGTSRREFVGTAIFNGDKMVGSLNPYETRYMLMIIGKFERGIMTIEDKRAPGKAIVVSIRNGRPAKVKGSFDDEMPVLDIYLNIEADIGAIHSRINYESTKLIESLNKQLEEEIKKGVEKTIEKTKREYKSDVFEFGKKFAGYFPTIQEWENYDWLSHYPETKVNVNVEVNVRRTGLNIDSSPIMGSPDPGGK